MKNTIKHSIFVVLIFILCTYFAYAQQLNNSPLIYRVSNDGLQPTGTGRVVITDPLTSKQIREIPLPIRSLSIELTRNQTKAYIAARIPIGSTGLGAILVDFNENNSNPVLPFLQGKVIYRLKLAPNSEDSQGLLWALMGDDNQILLLDPDSLKVIQPINNVALPVDIVFSPDGNKAYVALFDNTILVYDTKTRTVINTITGLPPQNNKIEKAKELAISSDGKMLSIGSKNIISFIDTVSFSINNFEITLPPFLVDKTQLKLLFHPNGNIIYIAESTRLYSYEISSVKLTQIFDTENIDLGNFIQDLTITPDGRLLYVSDFGGRIIVDTKAQSVIFTAVDSGFNIQNFAGIALTGDFTIGQAPTLQTTSPVANQQIMANRLSTISWQTTVAPQSFSIASHKIELSTDGGVTFNIIPGAEQLKPDAQSFTWNVPDIEAPKAQIRVSTVDLGARRASSTTSNFSISKGASSGDTQPPTVNFLSPKGGEKFNSGDTLQITWTSSDNVGVTSQDLSLSTDGGSTFPVTLASGLSGATQNFTYQIPDLLQSDQTRLKLLVRDGAGNSAQAITANNFSISLGADTIAPTVIISEPNQSKPIIAGQPIQVKWQSTDNRAVVSQALLLSFDGGKTFTPIMSFGGTENSFVLSNLDKLNFTTPQAMVKITATDTTGNKGEANSTFTISPAITNATYQTKVLTITGIGFMSNVNNTIKLFVNEKEVTLSPSNAANSSFTVKGNKKKLSVVKGSNTVKLVVDGVSSNNFNFSF